MKPPARIPVSGVRGVPETQLPKDRKSRAPRPDLSAVRIATEALRLIDEAGLDGFSFRILAARLGCQAMSLYHYYPSKAHLFEALVDICLAEAGFQDEGTWKERLRAVGHAYRRVALSHPGFFLYLATFRLNNRSGLTFLNRILRVFEETGLDAAARARHFRTLSYYLTGAAIDETMGYAHGPSAITPVPPDEAVRDFPAISAVGPYFAPEQHLATFEAGLDVLLDAIEADATTGRS